MKYLTAFLGICAFAIFTPQFDIHQPAYMVGYACVGGFITLIVNRIWEIKEE